MEDVMKKEIPELVIIDLDQDNNQISETEPDELEEVSEEPGKSGVRINMHVVLLATGIIVFSLIVYRVITWGSFISQEEIFSDGPGTYKDTLDNIAPLLDEEGSLLPLDCRDGLTIVAFGNAPFADDRDSQYNLANLIAERANATVYNCSIGESYLTAGAAAFSALISPMDAYTFYWLTVFAFGLNDTFYKDSDDVLGENAPSEAAEVIETLKSIDFNTVDAIIIMYDATDYLMGNPMEGGEEVTDPKSFTGNLAAGIELFQAFYPDIRILVLSPAYAFAIDENGEYVSSDVQRYGQDVLSSYSILEYGICYNMNVTFVDNLYGTITEDNAEEYLIDNLHLNVSGRKAVADRAVDALFYFGH